MRRCESLRVYESERASDQRDLKDPQLTGDATSPRRLEILHVLIKVTIS